MEQFSSLDLHYLAREIKFLEGNRIDSFYYDSNFLYIRVYVKSMGNFYIKISLGNYIYLKKDKDFQSENNNFVNYLRKFFKNTFIEKIENVQAERIIKFTISKKEAEDIKNYILIVEIFKPGNVIVCDEDLNIINSLLKKKFKDRIVKNKELYQLPPQKEQFIIKENLDDKRIVTFLAKEIGFGGKYSEEVLFRAKINKEKVANELTDDEIKRINEHIELIKNLDIQATIYYKNKKAINFSPFFLDNFSDKDYEIQTNNSFYEVLDKYYSNFEEKIDPQKKQIEKEIKKLKNRLNKLEEQKLSILDESKIYQEIGDKIYENYGILDELINVVNNLEVKKIENLPKKYQNFIDEINLKDKFIVLKENKSK